MQVDSTVHTALFFDLSEAQCANFTGAGHMGAAARLQINPVVFFTDPDKRMSPAPRGGLTAIVLTNDGAASSSASVIHPH